MPLPADRAHDAPHQQHDLPQEQQQDSLSRRLTTLPDGHPSSPNDEDGTPRKSTVDLRELELVDVSGDHERKQLQSPADRADRDGLSEGRDATSWQECLPEMRVLWERHLERWPEKPNPSVDRSADEPGSWRGDSGLFLSAADNKTADRILDRARQTEQKLTDSMTAIEAEIPGASLVGLTHRLKHEDRFKDKVAENLALKPGSSVDKEASAVSDAVRYTYQLPSDGYTRGYEEACSRLQLDGYSLIRCRNLWGEEQYKGINSRWQTSTGQLFEIQFHTRDSFEAKQLTHPAYERIRSNLATKEEMGELRQFQGLVTRSVSIPSGAAEIPNFESEKS
jgi:hypothetical protein